MSQLQGSTRGKLKAVDEFSYSSPPSSGAIFKSCIGVGGVWETCFGGMLAGASGTEAC